MPRRNRIDSDRLQTLEQRAAKAQRDLRRAVAQQKEQARADDARRKIIAGALALEHAGKNPASEFGRVMGRLLREYVRPQERWLLADTFRALLPEADAENLLAAGETARAEAERARGEVNGITPALPASPAPEAAA